MISKLSDLKVRERVASSSLDTRSDFEEVVAGLVAVSAPRLFAIVQQYGVGIDVRIAAWGMVTGDTAEVVTVEGRRFAVSPLEAVVPCFERGSGVLPYLVWVDTARLISTSAGAESATVGGPCPWCGRFAGCFGWCPSCPVRPVGLVSRGEEFRL